MNPLIPQISTTLSPPPKFEAGINSTSEFADTNKKINDLHNNAFMLKGTLRPFDIKTHHSIRSSILRDRKMIKGSANHLEWEGKS